MPAVGRSHCFAPASHGPVFVFLQRHCEAGFLASDHSADRDKLKLDGSIQERGPIHAYFHECSQWEVAPGGDQDAMAAHVLSEPNTCAQMFPAKG